MSDNGYYLGTGFVSLQREEEQVRLIHRLRQYLELRNVSLLLGNGCSLPLGSPVIGDVRSLIPELEASPFRLDDAQVQARARQTLDVLVPEGTRLGVEPLLTVLNNIQANEQILSKEMWLEFEAVPANSAESLERLLKKWLFYRCSALTETKDQDLKWHEELLRRMLLRSTTLPRAKVFTLNYDLLIERALDNLGVLYFDGFLGTINRTLRTESYHYDLYYPGETTEGRVTRVDRVLHLYKLHGSINWRRRRGLAGDVVINHSVPVESEYGDVMIYPSPLKVTEMNGYPYSEMFRHFSAQIHQPQSVLFAIGYGFQDNHVNRLIYQALSIPSFVLVIVTPSLRAPKEAEEFIAQNEIWRLKEIGSKRILILVGTERDENGALTGGAGTIQDFSTRWMPDITELNIEALAREEVNSAFPTKNGVSEINAD